MSVCRKERQGKHSEPHRGARQNASGIFRKIFIRGWFESVTRLESASTQPRLLHRLVATVAVTLKKTNYNRSTVQYAPFTSALGAEAALARQAL